MVWHAETALPAGTDLVVIPGGFSYGDYLRCGAIAARAPIMDAVRAHRRAAAGWCSASATASRSSAKSGLLPGVLMRNAQLQFICRTCYLRVERADTPFTRGYNAGQVIRVPVAHGEGNYFADDETIARLEGEGRVVFRYCSPDGEVDPRLEPQRRDQRDRRHRQRARQRARHDAAPGEPRRSRVGRHRRPRLFEAGRPWPGRGGAGRHVMHSPDDGHTTLFARRACPDARG